MEKIQVTKEQYGALQGAFEYYNKALFENKLPNVMLTFSRHKSCVGFFVPRQWYESDNEASKHHEISINPDYLGERTLKKSMSTLVHKMCHLLQEETGTAPRRCYHNKNFAEVMEGVGLITSSTGEKGGKRTGQNMTHYILEGGAFDLAFEAMPKDLMLPFSCYGLKKPANKKKVKKASSTISYVCPVCGTKLRGKEGLNIKCVECDEFFLPEH